MNTETVDNQIKVEEVAFWISMVSVTVMSVLFLAKAGNVILELPLVTITTAGFFGLTAAFFYGLQASLKGRPNHSAVKHILFSLYMLVVCLVLYVTGYSAFEFITSA